MSHSSNHIIITFFLSPSYPCVSFSFSLTAYVIFPFLTLFLPFRIYRITIIIFSLFLQSWHYKHVNVCVLWVSLKIYIMGELSNISHCIFKWSHVHTRKTVTFAHTHTNPNKKSCDGYIAKRSEKRACGGNSGGGCDVISIRLLWC